MTKVEEALAQMEDMLEKPRKALYSEREIDAMIAVAVKEEREACAKIADEYNDPASEIAYGKDARAAASEIALAIRARGK